MLILQDDVVLCCDVFIYTKYHWCFVVQILQNNVDIAWWRCVDIAVWNCCVGIAGWYCHGNFDRTGKFPVLCISASSLILIFKGEKWESRHSDRRARTLTLYWHKGKSDSHTSIDLQIYFKKRLEHWKNIALQFICPMICQYNSKASILFFHQHFNNLYHAMTMKYSIERWEMSLSEGSRVEREREPT